MNKFKLFAVAALSLSAASLSYAGTAAGGSATAADTIAVDTATCSGLKEDVTVQLSAANFGEVNCPSATAAGVAVANMKGKGKVYGASSNGGAITEGDFTITGDADGGAAAAATSAAATAAGAS